jgi:glyoxylase-like metal-dependent hydrolase (beta-lactamase superfamily II)
MSVEYRVISIGTLSRNPFWNETAAVRTPHATTTLITSGDKKILVDPALPPQVLDARLFERAGIRNKDITDVFLTSFRSAHRGALSGYDQADWYVHEKEKHHVRKFFEERYRHLQDDEELRQTIENNLNQLDRCKSAPDKLADQVEIYPSPGATAGCCGLLLTPSVGAIIVAGDAVINTEYLEHGQVWDDCFDIKLAQQSLQDILEIADVIIPGHDNQIPLLGKML